ncbi:flagellar hook-basal body complex protein FliE [Cupriavidus sp. WS]|uniref:flagellar hook-basal body complex protein FliE n=1 Tax=Cupriavidus sp. WS TaxID=1312922 RepID=UPI00035E7DFB|nr:flagellar hook-basal body complex protein FliE [Cupriavidus sp. WS]
MSTAALDSIGLAAHATAASFPGELANQPLSLVSGGFAGQLLDGAMRADAAMLTAQDMTRHFAAGENLPPHQVMLALEEARQSFQLLLQVRTRLVEGYQELMRMQL